MALWDRKKAPPIIIGDGKIDLLLLDADSLAVMKACLGRLTGENLSSVTLANLATIYAQIEHAPELQLLANSGQAYGAPIQQLKVFRTNDKRG